MKILKLFLTACLAPAALGQMPSVPEADHTPTPLPMEGKKQIEPDQPRGRERPSTRKTLPKPHKAPPVAPPIPDPHRVDPIK